jgi:hypothetical protein
MTSIASGLTSAGELPIEPKNLCTDKSAGGVARGREQGSLRCSACTQIAAIPRWLICPGDVTFDDNYVWVGSYHFSANIELWCGNAPIGEVLAPPSNTDRDPVRSESNNAQLSAIADSSARGARFHDV